VQEKTNCKRCLLLIVTKKFLAKKIPISELRKIIHEIEKEKKI